MYYLIITFILFLVYNIKLSLKLKKINEFKIIKYKIKDDDIIYPYISIIIYVFNEDINPILNSIKYDKNKYEIILISNLKSTKIYHNKINKIIKANSNFNIYDNIKFSLNQLNKKSKYTLILSNHMILTSNAIYDLVKFIKQNNLNSVSCLLNYPNYKDNIINNIYYHYKYLDKNRFFGELISNNIISDFHKIDTNILQKNLIIQNLPYITSIPIENKLCHYFNKLYILEICYFVISFLLLKISYIPIISLIVSIWFYYYKGCSINYGINDFNLLQSFYLLIFKLIIILTTLFHLPNFNYSKISKYPKLEYNSIIRPELSEKRIYDNGYVYSLKNYNLDIVYLQGSHYQMGYTIGKIYQKEIKEYIKLLDKFIPPFSVNPLWKNCGYTARTILKVIKKYSWKYISNENKEEIHGISDGSKVNSEDFILLSLFPSIFKAHCTILTDENIFLRTLDIDLMNDRFALFIYQANNMNKYVTFTLPGMNWCVTGFSEYLVIGEVFNDYCQVSTNRYGSPFYFNFKDLLLNSKTTNDIKNNLIKNNWHDSIDISIKSMKTKDLLMIEKRGNKTEFYNEDNFDNYLKKYSKNISKSNDKFSFYYNLDLIYNLINQYYKLEVIDVYNSIIVGLETGSNHSLIIDFNNDMIYISNATNKLCAYQRQMVEFELSFILSN